MLPRLFLHFSGVFILSLSSCTAVNADEYQIEPHFCFGSSHEILIEGRVIEAKNTFHNSQKSDGFFSNLWHNLNQFFNDEEENEPVLLQLSDRSYKAYTDNEGYFSFHLTLEKPVSSRNTPVLLSLANSPFKTSCKLLTITNQAKIGIISDFDDTVIKSNVENKAALLTNLLTKNYLQRELVPGMPEFFRTILKQKSNKTINPLIFVSASPRQIQKTMQKFLDLHDFPERIVITKKISGSNSDPLFDQFSYKIEKIKRLFILFPATKFVLIGDDGEKDPEVYHQLMTDFPKHIDSVWIRQVSQDPAREAFPNQHYFKESPTLSLLTK